MDTGLTPISAMPESMDFSQMCEGTVYKAGGRVHGASLSPQSRGTGRQSESQSHPAAHKRLRQGAGTDAHTPACSVVGAC